MQLCCTATPVHNSIGTDIFLVMAYHLIALAIIIVLALVVSSTLVE